MEQYLGQFEVYLLTEKRAARNTVLAYLQDLRQFANYLAKRALVFEQLELTQLKAYLLYLRKNQALAARSLARKISALKVFYNFLGREYQLDNLAAHLSLPKLERRLPQFLTETEIEQLLTQAQLDQSDTGQRNQVMLSLLYITGMRISELVNLQLSALDFESGLIKVLGKGDKERLVPVPKAFLAHIAQTYLNGPHANLQGKLGQAQPSPYLFPVLYGAQLRPITRQAFWQILKQLAQQTGIKTALSPHKLRHSLATHLLRKGANLRVLQLLLGHENLATVQIYTHVDTDYLRQIYDRRHPRS